MIIAILHRPLEGVSVTTGCLKLVTRMVQQKSMVSRRAKQQKHRGGPRLGSGLYGSLTSCHAAPLRPADASL